MEIFATTTLNAMLADIRQFFAENENLPENEKAPYSYFRKAEIDEQNILKELRKRLKTDY